MKTQIYISQKWKKLTAVLLVLNFFVTPLLNAFPQEECNGVCEISSVIHECSSEENIPMEMSCCDTMDMNSTIASSESGMEFSDMNCALVPQTIVNNVYIIPKTIDNKIEFIQITLINFDEDDSSIEFFDFIQDRSHRNEPPIYLTNASFLI